MLVAENIRDALEDYLKQQKKAGNKYCVLSARDINQIFEISKNYGNPRYRQIGRAMTMVRFYSGSWIEGELGHADFTVEYKLKWF